MTIQAGPENSATADRWIGRVIDQRYRVAERIGRGGMGVVYRVEHVRMGKIAALKLLHGNLSSNAVLVQRFQREAEAISKLSHPNIVQVFDFGQVENTLYLVMEYLSGRNLGEVLKRDGPRPWQRCVPLLVQVCDALTEAHALGIIHRDLKPENIQISRTKSGRDLVKVLDFGLAKMAAARLAAAESADGKHLVGTPYYMAPEQIRGQDLDQRCDVYGLGAVAYRVLTGRTPFEGSTPVAVLTKHITEQLVPPSSCAPNLDIPNGLDAVIGRAMAKRLEDRFGSSAEFKTALLEFANQAYASNGTGPHKTADVDIERRHDPDSKSTLLSRSDVDFERNLRRNRRLTLAGLVLTLIIAAGGVYLYTMRESPALAPSQETEPNDTPAKATLLAPGQPVTGQIGRRLNALESDHDWYRFSVGPHTQLLKATLSALPNMDVAFDLYDHLGGRLIAVDSGGVGGREMLPNWALVPGNYYIVVREARQQGALPTENVTDTYQLRIDLQAPPEGWEHEPNDAPEQTNELHLGRPCSGIAGNLGDRDTYSLQLSGAAVLVAKVSGVTGLDLTLKVWQGHRLARARTADRGTISEGEQLRFRVRGNDPVFIQVGRKRTNKLADRAVAGLDQPYQLLVERTDR